MNTAKFVGAALVTVTAFAVLGSGIPAASAEVLSSEEETELHAMKKEKLFLKDQMFDIAQEHKEDLARISS